MKKFTNRRFYKFAVLVVVNAVLISAFAFLIARMYESDNPREEIGFNDACAFSKTKYDELVEDLKTPYIPGPNMGALAPVTQEWLDTFEGQCVIDVLTEWTGSNVSAVNDRTDCWPNCTETADYSETRVSFTIKNGAIYNIKQG